MASSMWQQQLTLILLLGVICARCTAAPLADDGDEDEDELLLVMTTTEKQHRIDCKLALDATMDSLEQQQLLEAMGCSRTNKPATTTTTTTTTDVEQDEEQTVSPSVLRHSRPGGSSQPLYELQLVVWPAGVDGNGDDGIVPVVVTTPRTTRATTTTPTTTSTTTTASPMTTTTTTTPSVGVPLYEDQLVVFPQMDFQEENFDYFFDESSSTTTKRPTSSSSSNAATSSKPVYVLENFRKQHPNGTEEHKLVLSNGLVNYMKHYPKQVDDKVINVQEGYSSLPVAGVQPQIQTLHYIADEHGYNIHKIERSPLPLLLSQRALPKATEAPTATTSTM
ncbi:serine proteinase stubble [Drosophila albomicans]|uniref:Serine proteinase stubble n=1 Tax=Drosophila albomicans TaxID=7291 RepID=A0A6P8XCJ3_DROAB|nr:serine proteinase stubble [Drosophila albomicans]